MATQIATFRLPGTDRDVEVLTAGDPGGIALLYHAGTPSAVAEYAPFDRLTAEHGLRLVSYSRPGYGASTPRPAPGRFVDDVAESRAVLDHLGIEEFLTFGWSGGGPRALGCAALMPERCRAAASLAGVGPADAPDLDWTAGMAEENEDEYAAARAGVAAYEEYLQESVMPVLQITADDFVEAMGDLVTPVDKAALTPELVDWMVTSFRRAGAQGIVGVRDDGLAAVDSWGFDLNEIRVPVAIWQGRQDAMVPYAHGEWLVAHVPGARAHLFDDEGHISLVHRLGEVLADLKQLGGY